MSEVQVEKANAKTQEDNAALGLVVAGKYKLDQKLGEGSFGVIYLGIDRETSDEVAIKLEGLSVKHPLLLREYKVYEALAGGIGIPRVHWYGKEGACCAMVMDLLGPTLEELFVICERKFSLRTVLMLADMMLSTVEHMHRKGFVHRDLKPDNFLIGHGAYANQLYLIDMGLAKKFRRGDRLPCKDTLPTTVIGTARYASLNTHMGLAQGRRDDLEALGYVLIYLLTNHLPWQGLKAKTHKEKYEKIKEKKVNTSLEEICINCPIEFQTYLAYVRSLSLEEKPDYKYLRRLFQQLLKRQGLHHELAFDWAPKAQGPLNIPMLANDSSNGIHTPATTRATMTGMSDMQIFDDTDEDAPMGETSPSGFVTPASGLVQKKEMQVSSIFATSELDGEGQLRPNDRAAPEAPCNDDQDLTQYNAVFGLEPLPVTSTLPAASEQWQPPPDYTSTRIPSDPNDRVHAFRDCDDDVISDATSASSSGSPADERWIFPGLKALYKRQYRQSPPPVDIAQSWASAIEPRGMRLEGDILASFVLAVLMLLVMFITRKRFSVVMPLRGVREPLMRI